MNEVLKEVEMQLSRSSSSLIPRQGRAAHFGAKGAFHRAALLVAAMAGVLAHSQPAHAQAYVVVSDVSQIDYQTSGNYIYFRNFNQFNPSAMGCCQNYWIDTTTPEGKNIFALMLSASAQGKPMIFGVPTNFAAGLVQYSGYWAH